MYNNAPYNIGDRSLTFSQVYSRWFKSKYEDNPKGFSLSTVSATETAYKWTSPLHNRIFSELRTPDLQNILDGADLGYNSLRQIRTLFTQMYRYALEYELCSKDYAHFIQIKKPDDTESGSPFTKEEIALLWANVDAESKHQSTITALLILIYSGWRISEFLNMPLSDIDLEEWTMMVGTKTTAGEIWRPVWKS